MATMLFRINEWLCSYSRMVNNLGPRSLMTLALATACYVWYAVPNLPSPFDQKNVDVIQFTIVALQIALSIYVLAFRRQPPPPPPPANPLPVQPLQPQPPPELQYLKVFAKSVIPSVAVAFFVAIDDPLKSVKSYHVHGICLVCFFYVLILLAIFRRRNDYGISDGCLAASYGVMYSLNTSYLSRILFIFPVILLGGFRNVQLEEPAPVPVPPPNVNLHQILISNTQLKKERKRNFKLAQTSGTSGQHCRRGSL